MEDLWKRAKSIAEEAAKTTQTLTTSTKLSDLVSETAKKSKELAAEASKTADLFKTAAFKQADQFKSLSVSDIIPPQLSSISIPPLSSSPSPYSPSDIEKLGLSDDLRDFVKGFTSSTFQNFPIQDETEALDVPSTASNVRKDLNEWQEKHATLVVTTVKEISRLRYELCPRTMKERRFWRIYFTLVSSHVAPYEKKYMEEVKLKAEEQMKEEEAKQTLAAKSDTEEGTEKSVKDRTSNVSTAEQDLDSFLLGDLEDSDGGADVDESFDDDFDKIDNSDVEDEKPATA